MLIRSLNPAEAQALQDGLALASRLIGKTPPFSGAQVQALYDAILEDGEGQEATRIALGLAFGEMIVGMGCADWVRIADEYGEETGLRHKKATVVCHPISMIDKRISGREPVDVVKLCSDTIKALEDMVTSGKY